MGKQRKQQPEGLRQLGRLIVRKGKTVGLYFPFVPGGLQNGIWEIREVLGELTLVYLGEPAMPDARYQGRDVRDLVHDPSCAMTPKEWDEVCKSE